MTAVIVRLAVEAAVSAGASRQAGRTGLDQSRVLEWPVQPPGDQRGGDAEHEVPHGAERKTSFVPLRGNWT